MAIELAPNSEMYRGYLSFTIIRAYGDTARARQVYEREPRQQFRFDSNPWNRIMLRCCIDWLEPRLSSYSRGYSYYLLRAEAAMVRQDSSRAVAHFDSALVLIESSTDPGHVAFRAWMLSGLGVAYAGIGDKVNAIRFGKEARELLPISLDAFESKQVLQGLAEIYVMTGEYQSAIDVLEILLSNPSNFSAKLISIDPKWKPLHGMQRYQDLLDKY
jgi:tetratricopeptide (TPR) repeat protein